jgi:hypothetical protein
VQYDDADSVMLHLDAQRDCHGLPPPPWLLIGAMTRAAEGSKRPVTRARHLETGLWKEVVEKMSASAADLYVDSHAVEVVGFDTVWLDNECVPAMPVLLRYRDGLVSMHMLYSADFRVGWGFVSLSSSALDALFESHGL